MTMTESRMDRLRRARVLQRQDGGEFAAALGALGESLASALAFSHTGQHPKSRRHIRNAMASHQQLAELLGK
jgi:hypothetical protein